jgi:membrane protease YdiL (CAAX protease family)
MHAPVPVGDTALAWLGAWLGGGLVATTIIVLSGSDGDGPYWLVLSALLSWVPLLGVTFALSRRYTGSWPSLHPRRGDLRLVDLLGLPAGVVAQFVLVPAVYWPLRAVWPDAFDPTDIERRARDLWNSASGVGTVLVVLVVVVGAPIVEELVYRGLLQRSLGHRFGRWSALVIASAWFAAVHLQPVEFPGLFVAGLVFGVGLAITGRVGAGVMAHVGFNISGLMLVAL